MTNLPAMQQPSGVAVLPDEIEPDPLDQVGYEGIVREFHRRRQYHWALLTRILRATGLRESEVLRLRPEHIERNGPDTFLLVLRGKQRLKEGHRSRYQRVSLQADVAGQLDQYMGGHRVARGFPIFECKARAYQYAFKAAAIEATGEPHHPHELRALYAVDLLEQGYALEVVSRMLGHTSTRTTQEFYLRFTSHRRNQINQRVRA